jgi:hypothetical protein
MPLLASIRSVDRPVSGSTKVMVSPLLLHPATAIPESGRAAGEADDGADDVAGPDPLLDPVIGRAVFWVEAGRPPWLPPHAASCSEVRPTATSATERAKHSRLKRFTWSSG